MQTLQKVILGMEEVGLFFALEKFKPILTFDFRQLEYVNPIIFGLFSPELWSAVKAIFCRRDSKVGS